MTNHAVRWSIAGFVAVVFCTSTGCTRSIELRPSPEQAQPAITHALASTERVPLVLDSFQQSRNGAPHNPSAETERRILNRIHSTQLFATVIPVGAKSDSRDEKIVSARITMEEAIELYTLGAAYAQFMEDRKGMIKKGYLGDVVIVNQDLMTIPEEDIMKTKIDYTIVGGKVVFKRNYTD